MPSPNLHGFLQRRCISPMLFTWNVLSQRRSFSVVKSSGYFSVLLHLWLLVLLYTISVENALLILRKFNFGNLLRNIPQSCAESQVDLSGKKHTDAIEKTKKPPEKGRRNPIRLVSLFRILHKEPVVFQINNTGNNSKQNTQCYKAFSNNIEYQFAVCKAWNNSKIH